MLTIKRSLPLMLALFTVASFLGPVVLAQEGGGGADLDVDIGTSGGDGWAVGPTWLIIGGIALVVIILAIALGARGSGSATTIVRD